MASLLEREKIEVYRYNWFAVIFVTAAALAAQWTLPLLSPFFSNFDLPLLVTIYFALARRSPVGGMVTGCILGLIQDAMSGRFIGIFGISKTVVGYVASSLGACHPLLCLPTGGTQDDLYHQRHRESERQAAPLGAYPRTFPERRGGDEIDLAAIARDHSKVEDATEGMTCGESPVRGGVRRSIRGQSLMNRLRAQNF